MHLFSFFRQQFRVVIFLGMMLWAMQGGAYEIGGNDFCASDCNACSCCNWEPYPFAGDISIAYDSFRSLPQGSFNGDYGALTSFNLGTGFPYLSCYGLGVQVGASYALYQWSGRGSVNNRDSSSLRQQSFVTAGFFRRTPYGCGVNGAVVYDCMINTHYGVFSNNPNFDQVRYQLGYQWNECDEVGFWGTARLRTSSQPTFGIPVYYRALGQVSLFWKHHFCTRAWTNVWLGLPYNQGLMFAPGRDGNFLAGGSFSVPLNYCFSIDGHAMYMSPRSGRPGVRSRNDATNVCVGLTYSFGGACCNDGCNVRPYLPLADNSNFIADTNLNF